MRYFRYGVELERLKENHLEMVRTWRNQAFVRLQMEYQQEIDKEEQLQWFKTLNPERDWYFVAFKKEEPFGLFHIKHIDWKDKYGESGGFIGSEKAIGSMDPGIAILALMEFAFLILELDSLVAKYQPGHPQIARLNDQLGYEIFAEGESGFVRARVTKSRFFEKALPVRKAAQQLRGSSAAIQEPDAYLAGKIKAGDQERRFNI